MLLTCSQQEAFLEVKSVWNMRQFEMCFTACAEELKQILLGTNLSEDEFASNQSGVEIATVVFFPLLVPLSVLHEQNSFEILCK